jgi:hypothetical protein
MHESDIEKLFFEYGNLQKDFFVYKVPDQRKCDLLISYRG